MATVDALPVGGLFVEREGRRELTVGVDLRLKIGDLLLRAGDGIGAREKTPWRRLLARNRDQRMRELRRVAGLLAVLRFQYASCAALRSS